MHRRPASPPLWSPLRLSGARTPRKYLRRVAQNGAARGSFAQICLVSVWPVDSAGKITKAILPPWRGVHPVRHGRFFLRPPSQHRRRMIHGASAEMTYRADFSRAPVCVLVNSPGDAARASTPLDWFANAALFPAARVSPGGGRNADAAEMPPARNVLSDVCLPRTRLGRLRQSSNGAYCFEKASSPNFFAARGLCPV